MITEHMNEGDNFLDLPELYIIFVCEHDEDGNGRAVNEYMYLNTDRFTGNPEIEEKIKAHASMCGRTHILRVNGDYKDSESDIGRLIRRSNKKYPYTPAELIELKKNSLHGTFQISIYSIFNAFNLYLLQILLCILTIRL